MNFRICLEKMLKKSNICYNDNVLLKKIIS